MPGKTDHGVDGPTMPSEDRKARAKMDCDQAGPNKRVCAFMVDVMLAQIGGLLLSLAFAKNVNGISLVAVILLRDCLNGQSLGKYLAGIRVVDDNNVPIRPVKAIIRNMPMIIPLVILVEWVWMIDRGKRLGDRLAKARVSDLRPQISDYTFLWGSFGLGIIWVLLKIGLVWIVFRLQPALLTD